MNGEALTFVHKRVFRGIKGFVEGGPIRAIGGFLSTPSRKGRGRGTLQTRRPPPITGFTRPPRIGAPPPPPIVRRPPPRTQTARPSIVSAAEKQLGAIVKFAGPSLPQGAIDLIIQAGGDLTGITGRTGLTTAEIISRSQDLIRGGFSGLGQGRAPIAAAIAADPCPTIGSGKGVIPAVQDFFLGGNRGGGGPTMTPGNALMGRYGAGLEPGIMPIDRAVCLRGMVLGNDGVCYNKSQIRNADRMWPRGRRPLLTGGDMRSISIAARAGKRLEGATKRLQKIGLMKKPSRAARRAPKDILIHHHD